MCWFPRGALALLLSVAAVVLIGCDDHSCTGFDMFEPRCQISLDQQGRMTVLRSVEHDGHLESIVT